MECISLCEYTYVCICQVIILLYVLPQQSEMQRAVEFRFTDQSTLVREAAVDFVGRFILNRPELTLQYYAMLCQRIRVT